MKKILAASILISLPAIAQAWQFGDNVTITAVTLWEDSTVNPMYFQASNGLWCYVPSDQKNIQSLILTLYASGKPAELHCHDTPEAVMGGVPDAYKFHRIIAK